MAHWPEGYDGDKLGIVRTKQSAPLHAIQLASFQASIDWLKRHIAQRGYLVLSVDLDAELALWRFRVGGEGCIRVPHDLVQRLETCLDWIQANASAARRASAILVRSKQRDISVALDGDDQC